MGEYTKVGTCDVCDKWPVTVTRCTVCGIETWACNKCRRVDALAADAWSTAPGGDRDYEQELSDAEYARSMEWEDRQRGWREGFGR